MVYIPIWYWNKNTIKYPYSTGIKNWNPWYRYVIGNQKKMIPRPTLDHSSNHICTEYAWQWHLSNPAEPNNIFQFMNVLIPCMLLISSKCMWPKNWWQWCWWKIEQFSEIIHILVKTHVTLVLNLFNLACSNMIHYLVPLPRFPP